MVRGGIQVCWWKKSVIGSTSEQSGHLMVLLPHLQLIEQGWSNRAACAAVGVNERTGKDWKAVQKFMHK